MTHCVIFVFCCLFVCFFFYISQYITTQIFRVCMKELNRHQGYDPVTVTSLIIGNSHLLSFLWFVLELGCTQQLLIRSIANINDSL